MSKIITAENKKIEVECIGCAIAKKEIDMIGGVIAETENFNVANDLEYPIRGFLIIGTKLHIRRISDFTEGQIHELIDFIYKVRITMKEVLDIDKITIVQEEGSEDSHFHIWLFPWHEWMQDIGSGLPDMRKIMEFSKENHKTPKVMDEIRRDSDSLRGEI